MEQMKESGTEQVLINQHEEMAIVQELLDNSPIQMHLFQWIHRIYLITLDKSNTLQLMEI